MKVGILTQPLCTNYGGILQNYALQQLLKRMGHEVWTIDYQKFTWWNWTVYTCRVIVLKLLGYQASFCMTPFQKKKVEMPLRRFAYNHMQLTKRTRFLERSTVKHYAFDAIVVGSDQVWRPKYNSRIEDCFLSFTIGLDIKRVAYAVSFGTDDWEFSTEQTDKCATCAKMFDGISVREKSGITLCEKYLDVKATHVLDPTLLLSADDYSVLCCDIPKRKPFVFAYILDMDEKMKKNVMEFAKYKRLPYIIKGADETVRDNDSIESWLSYFRDAVFVITNSFHGTAFSIIFNKDFYVFGNKMRGNCRFDSLLETYDLKNRLVTESILEDSNKIDWDYVNKVSKKEQIKSQLWLAQNL